MDPLSPGERKLQQRAWALATAPVDRESSEGEGFLVFEVAEGEYAAELALLRSVVPAAGLTRLPCAPPHVAGILNVRGEILTILNLATALGHPGSSTGVAQGWVLLVQHEDTRAGLLVDNVLGVESVHLEQLDRSPRGGEFTQGIARGTLAVLDLRELLGNDRLDVFSEID